ncbi:aminoacyl-tRNA hydrolase [Stagnihabitans tardus]|uniref:Peptidyl-tRNA hydrolase n=1 Tax=Stagnihabitans tardus TaxID=2699202 RepID=A0AAE5BVI3_9RHOB|nr:aminoacyl-tRNA hydrolase [Stagnihabitans tardus]NBZ88956.1 aminoacyl-tRNA hydrolase [Stagnihabitans tardus]
MKLWTGLGNPGPEYQGNRHNIGFMALDRIALDHGFGPWKKDFHGRVSEGRLGGEKLLLLKPETFMNLSGRAVQAAMAFHKIPPADLVVFHDELDLGPGKIKVKMGGGHAGHNGLRSIHGAIGEAYGRVRLGIGHPGHKDLVAGYVLHDFAKSDRDGLELLLQGISEGAPFLAQGEEAKFLNAVSLRVNPPRNSGKGPEGGEKVAVPKEPKPAPTAEAEPALSPLERLMQKFKG